MRIFILTFCLFRFFSSHAQESCKLSGEIDFPYLNHYSAYGVNDTLAERAIAVYERNYKKAKSKKKQDQELQLFALVKKYHLFFNPYVIVKNNQGEELIIYMDSVTYQKTFVWDYHYEDLTANQNYLWFEAKGIWLGENAYWLTEFNQITLMEDKNRRLVGAKFARDVYRK
ncbi:hypothetical protein D3C71_536340 [compost metagenome]